MKSHWFSLSLCSVHLPVCSQRFVGWFVEANIKTGVLIVIGGMLWEQRSSDSFLIVGHTVC